MHYVLNIDDALSQGLSCQIVMENHWNNTRHVTDNSSLVVKVYEYDEFLFTDPYTVLGCKYPTSVSYDTVASRWSQASTLDRSLSHVGLELQKAAQSGSVLAQSQLLQMWINNRNLVSEFLYAQVVTWYQKASEKHDPQAWYNLSQILNYGLGVEKDLEQGIPWLMKAADHGHTEAQYQLAICYEYERGLEKNMNQSSRWYKKAAEHGHMMAQYNLAYCYQYGQGIEMDLMQAFEWYRRAAKQGHPSSQYRLGLCYQYGLGGDINLQKAIQWYHKAAKQGYTKARQRIIEYVRQNVDLESAFSYPVILMELAIGLDILSH